MKSKLIEIIKKYFKYVSYKHSCHQREQDLVLAGVHDHPLPDVLAE